MSGEECPNADDAWNGVSDCNHCSSGYLNAAFYNIVNEGWCNICGQPEEDEESEFPYGHDDQCWVAGAIRWQREWETKAPEPVASQMTGMLRMGKKQAGVKTQSPRKRKGAVR